MTSIIMHHHWRQLPSPLRNLTQQQRRQLRLAIGVTLAMTLAVTAAWPLAFIAIILTCSLMSSEKPCMTIKQGGELLSVIIVVVGFGLLVSSLFADTPLLCIAVVAVCLLNAFFLNTGGLNSLLVTLLLITITLLPLMAQQSYGLALLVSVGLFIGVVTALCINWLLHALIPDVEQQPENPQDPLEINSVQTLDKRIQQARNSLVAVLPVVIAVYSFELTNSALVMIFAVILAQNPDLQAGYKGCMGLLLGNTLGGLIAVLIYALLTLVPSLSFLVLMTFVFASLCAQRIFSAHRMAPVASMVLSTICLLIGSVLLGDGTSAGEKFIVRIFQIFIVTLYVVGAFSLLTLDWKTILGRLTLWRQYVK
ncbi:Protein of unknown function (DUF2955) [Alteromonadaceae bacterium 2753L.S.0a.02]|nr:Protein of unknown function (DUF2955) [Alteromonadaceae bacterium 2753L.S.0a.02]